MSTQHIFLPHSSAKLRAMNRHSVSARIHGRGAPSFLLDGGIGGQSSYQSVDDYMNITGRDPYNNKMSRPQLIPALKSGTGLADKIASKLSKLSLDKPNKPKKKNIVMSF
jgi:hypothetical protein